jgi:uncharacterized protein YdhG (YjbR/CyaY superfamily)
MVVLDERIDRYLDTLSPQQQVPLRHLRAALAELLPDGEETIKYRMPCITVGGKGVACYDAFTHHWSYFPMSGNVLGRVSGLPSWVDADKGTLRVPLDRTLSAAVVKRLVRARLDEIEAMRTRRR